MELGIRTTDSSRAEATWDREGLHSCIFQPYNNNPSLQLKALSSPDQHPLPRLPPSPPWHIPTHSGPFLLPDSAQVTPLTRDGFSPSSPEAACRILLPTALSLSLSSPSPLPLCGSKAPPYAALHGAFASLHSYSTPWVFLPSISSRINFLEQDFIVLYPPRICHNEHLTPISDILADYTDMSWKVIKYKLKIPCFHFWVSRMLWFSGTARSSKAVSSWQLRWVIFFLGGG